MIINLKDKSFEYELRILFIIQVIILLNDDLNSMCFKLKFNVFNFTNSMLNLMRKLIINKKVENTSLFTQRICMVKWYRYRAVANEEMLI